MELEKNGFNLNENQKRFIDKCRIVFNDIDNRKVASGSTVRIENGSLIIWLIHKLDPETSVLIKVDNYEIYLTCAGMGDSMFHQFPGIQGEEFYSKVKDYVLCALNGEFSKELYLNKKGEHVKAVLKWRDEKFKKSVFMPFRSFKSLFFRESLNKREFNYSSFLK